MNTNLEYAFYTENFEIYKFQFKTYGMGMWYDPKLNSYDEIIELLKEHIYEKVQKDNPHLIMLKPQADEVIQVEKNNYGNINYKGIPMDVAPPSPFIRKDEPEKINKGTIEEPYDIIKEINSSKSLTVLSIYEKQCKTEEQKNAYGKKRKELSPKPKIQTV